MLMKLLLQMLKKVLQEILTSSISNVNCSSNRSILAESTKTHLYTQKEWDKLRCQLSQITFETPLILHVCCCGFEFELKIRNLIEL